MTVLPHARLHPNIIWNLFLTLLLLCCQLHGSAADKHLLCHFASQGGPGEYAGELHRTLQLIMVLLQEEGWSELGWMFHDCCQVEWTRVWLCTYQCNMSKLALALISRLDDTARKHGRKWEHSSVFSTMCQQFWTIMNELYSLCMQVTTRVRGVMQKWQQQEMLSKMQHNSWFARCYKSMTMVLWWGSGG